MTSQRDRRAEEIFLRALELPPADAPAFLDEACKGEPDLRAEIVELLAADRDATGFLDDSALRALEVVPTWSDGSVTSLVESPERYRHIGPYELLRPLGEGETSTVLLAVRADPHYRRLVAIKLVKRGMDTDSILRRFRQERQILADLDHPNIATLHDGGSTDDGRPYFVMEYVLGERIDRYCDRLELSIGQRIDLFRTVCSAVHHAHQSLIIHRDLKPGNILITPRGAPKLLDFGIAKLIDPELESERTATMGRLMTPRYASPEQVRGQPVTTATDVYSLGVLLYELLTGRPPYSISNSAMTEIEEVVCNLQSEPPSTTVRREDGNTAVVAVSGGRDRLARRLSGDLDTIVMTALRKQPRRRYASVQELAEDLRRYQRRLPIVARRDSLGYRADRFLRRNVFAVAAAAAVVLSLMAGLAATTWQARVARAAQSAAEAERAEAQQVSEFLVELFRVSDPEAEASDELTAREMLDRGAAGITEELADQPELQATLMTTMGRAYRSLGLYDASEPLLRRALELRRHTLDPTRTELASSLNELATLLHFRGHFDEAEGLYSEALTSYNLALGEGNAEAATVLNNLSNLLTRQGKYAESERMSRMALAIHREHFGEEHPMVASDLNHLAIALTKQGKYDEAEPMRREVVVLVRKVFGENHPYVASSLNNLSAVLDAQAKYREAETVQREALRLFRSIHGDVHPQVATGLNNLGTNLHDQGRYPESEELLREAVTIYRTLLGDGHPHVASALRNLASVLMQTDRHGGAEPLLEEALAIQRDALGEQHPDFSKTLGSLATARFRLGDVAGAKELYLRSISLASRTLSDDRRQVATGLVGLGRLHTETGEPAQAEPLLREAVSIRRASYSDGDWRTAEAEGALGACLTALGRFDEAEQLLVASHRVFVEQFGPDSEQATRAGLRLEQLAAARARSNERHAVTERG